MIPSGFALEKERELAQAEDDRRRHPRFACRGEAEMRSLGTGRRAVGKIGNLSAGGCLMLLEETKGFRRDEALEMTFCVRQLPLRVQGSVRQIHPGYGVGVEFSIMSERGRRQLLDLIRELDELLHDQMHELEQAQKEAAANEECGKVRRIRR